MNQEKKSTEVEMQNGKFLMPWLKQFKYKYDWR